MLVPDMHLWDSGPLFTLNVPVLTPLMTDRVEWSHYSSCLESSHPLLWVIPHSYTYYGVALVDFPNLTQIELSLHS